MKRSRSVRRARIGLVAGGLGAYWPQFPDLLPQLERSARVVSERIAAIEVGGAAPELTDVGFISDAADGAKAAETLRAAGCDLIACFLTIYMTASMLAPVAQRSGAPVLLINLQPTPAMDHATFDTGQWLAYCGACPLPEMAKAFTRLGGAVPLGLGLPRRRARLGADRHLGQGGGRAGRRCVLDSLALAYRRAVLQAQELSGRHADVIHVVGGGSRNDLLCQLTADAAGLPVVAGPAEATALGNVLVQGRAPGAAPGTLAGMRALVRASAGLRQFGPAGDQRGWQAASRRLGTG